MCHLLVVLQLFMIKTGFYDVAKRNASERREIALEEQMRRQQRMKELNITFAKDNEN